MENKCPRCGSKDFYLNGVRKRVTGDDTQQYRCKDKNCNKQWVDEPLKEGRPPLLTSYDDEYWCRNHLGVRAKAKGLCANCYATHRRKEREKKNLNPLETPLVLS